MQHTDCPRVLIISHNVLNSTHSMGKTLSAFFAGLPAENIAQLYFHNQMPISGICEQYFRITDYDMLQSLLTRKAPGSHLARDAAPQPKTSGKRSLASRLYAYGKRRTPITYLARNRLWHTKRWQTSTLYAWIESFAPDVLFLASGDYAFSHEIALHIAARYSLPMVVGIYDDFYFYNRHRFSPLGWLVRRQYRRVFDLLMAGATHCLFSNDALQTRYQAYFQVPGITLMTPCVCAGEPHAGGLVPAMAYTGNLGLGRWQTLIAISKALCLLPAPYCRMQIDVYCGGTSKAILRRIRAQQAIRFHGAIDSAAVKAVQRSSAILLHVESSKKPHRRRTQHSFSTKIAESLGSGACLLAAGPPGIASMQYLAKHACAFIVTDMQQLPEALHRLLSSSTLRVQLANAALQTAQVNHNAATNQQAFAALLNAACRGERP